MGVTAEEDKNQSEVGKNLSEEEAEMGKILAEEEEIMNPARQFQPFKCPREMDAPPSPEQQDWLELPLEPLHLVFSKLGAADLLMGAGLVCHSWLEAAKQPDLWRSVHTRHHYKVVDMSAGDLWEMLKAAVDRSAGGMEVFVGDWFLTDNLLKYIGDRSPSLKVLDLVECTNISYEGLAEVIPRFPLLERIMLSGYNTKYIGTDLYQVIGKACTQLKCLELHHGNTEQTLGIAALQELRELVLVGCDVDDGELEVVVDSCPQLERLHVSGCFKIVGNTVLRAKCARIKAVKLQTYRDSYYCCYDF